MANINPNNFLRAENPAATQPQTFSFMDKSVYDVGGNQITPPQSPTITVDSLQPVQPIKLPTPVPAPSVADTLVSSISNTPQTISDYITSLTPPQTEADKTQQTILDRIAELTGQGAGKQQSLAQERINQGIPELQRQLQDINNQITTGNAAYAKTVADYNLLNANLGGNQSVETKAVLAAQQAGLARNFEAQKASKAAELGMLAARAQALSGNINTALQIAQNAVDAKYSPIEDELKIREAQLNALAPTLNKQEKTIALAQQAKLQQDQQDLADKKAAQKENISLALTAGIQTKFTNKNGTFFNTATGEQYATPSDFFKAAGVSSFEEAYQRGLVTDFTPAKLADFNQVQQMMAKYPDAGIKANDSLDVALTKLRNSAIYRRETYIAPTASTTADVANTTLLELLQNVGQDGKVDPQTYLQVRAKSKLSASEFDNRFGYTLSPQEQKNLGITSSGKPATDTQNQAATYATRMQEASSKIDQLANGIAKYNQIGFYVQQRLPNPQKSSIIQQYEQASRNLINAILRRESGAVISQSEFDNAYEQYLPRPGDGPEVLAQKKQNRDTVLNGLIQSAGPAYNPTSSTKTVVLKDPKTGEVRTFTNLSDSDLKDALNQGYIQQ